MALLPGAKADDDPWFALANLRAESGVAYEHEEFGSKVLECGNGCMVVPLAGGAFAVSQLVDGGSYEIHHIRPHSREVGCCVYIPYSGFVVSVTMSPGNEQVVLWDPRSLVIAGTGNCGAVAHCVDYVAACHCFVVGGECNVLHCFLVADMHHIRIPIPFRAPPQDDGNRRCVIRHLRYWPDSDYLLVGGIYGAELFAAVRFPGCNWQVLRFLASPVARLDVSNPAVVSAYLRNGQCIEVPCRRGA